MIFDRFDWMVPTLVGGVIWVGCDYLETLLSRSGWAIQNGQSWQLVVSGWALLPYCWPIFLAGTAIGFVLFELLQIGLWERTRGRLLQQHLDDAIQAKMDARRLARTEFAEREMRLTRRGQEIQQREDALDAERAAWLAHNQDVQQQLDNERDRANRAESKLHNASGAVGRRKGRTNKSGGGSPHNPSKFF
jgi:hypothetical protein